MVYDCITDITGIGNRSLTTVVRIICIVIACIFPIVDDNKFDIARALDLDNSRQEPEAITATKKAGKT